MQEVINAESSDVIALDLEPDEAATAAFAIRAFIVVNERIWQLDGNDVEDPDFMEVVHQSEAVADELDAGVTFFSNPFAIRTINNAIANLPNLFHKIATKGDVFEACQFLGISPFQLADHAIFASRMRERVPELAIF
jgi:hypothetical protein